MKLRPMPYHYRHPSKDGGTDAPPIEGEPFSSVQPKLADKLVPPTAERVASDVVVDGCALRTITIRIGIPLPLVRTVPLYDRLLDAGLSERTAALKVGHRAIDRWRGQPGAELQVPALGELEVRSSTIETTKAIDRTVFAKIGRELDPYGVHSARLIGRMLGHAVLTWWIAMEAKT